MKKLSLLIVLFAVVALSGCAAVPYQTGPLYSDYQAPNQTTQNQVGSKVGTSCMNNILGLISTGDASLAAATKEANISEVATVDTKFNTVLGIYSTTCTTVTGN